MQTKQTMTIFWRNTNGETYQHGSTIRFQPNGTYFENQLMPSGLPIHLWTMTTQFDKEGRTPSLPILKRGHRYRLTFEVAVNPVGSVYFVLTFYRKNDTEIKQLMINETNKDFEFPKAAYRYDIRLMNAACHQLLFRRIVIAELAQEDDVKSTPSLYEAQVNDIIRRTRAQETL
ncbi:accessory Sec system protein Asp3 [Staphylococcus ursi]|uniref:accessory Sec system protein Asp3 n=1 Tax=Staphylococcus sp. MI 10-1553 TaxID=1912064 RepID=UPI001398CF48|nr:accessory Sec system protein Asp3 [Staphylococcus sp. MI 10-1553]QHW35950.1 accessory Sec system protein Asp3 [Staphylococcus sp. MI 10-1553]